MSVEDLRVRQGAPASEHMEDSDNLKTEISGQESTTNTSDDGPFGAEDITYPEGGASAWAVTAGSWCAMTAGLGLVNSTGILQAYISNDVLVQYSDSTTGWILGVYVFVSYFGGVQTGPIFDAKGPRGLMVFGSVCIIVGIFTLSVSTQYYQILLSFAILSGIGNSCLFSPAMGAISHWFNKRRGEATGFAFIGSGLGGVIFPLMFQSLIPRVGRAWTFRIIGFVLLALCIASVALCRSRLPPRKGAATTWRDTLPDLRIFWDGTGAMALTSIGVFLVEWAYFVPITYVPSYYLARQGLSGKDVINGEGAFAYQILAILNGASCFGRYLPAYIADKLGRYNIMIVSNVLCILSVFGLWLPDAVVSTKPNVSLLLTFVVVFGFASGANIALTPICVGQLCEVQEYGRYYASAYTIVSIGCLTSIPIAGSLIDAVDTEGRQRYWAVITFTGLSYIASFACFLWVRIRIKGWNWRTIW